MTSEKIMFLIMISSLAVVFNMGMGLWRKTVRKYSWQWFLAIHLAVPLIFLLRTEAGISSNYIPELVLFSVAGQVVGGKMIKMG
jgi:hypothetical protein